MKLLTEFWSVLEQLFEELLQQRDSCMFKARVNDNLKEYVVVVVVVKAKFATFVYEKTINCFQYHLIDKI